MRFDLTLYLVSDSTGLSEDEFLRRLEQALRGGVTLLQLREKNRTTLEYYELARKVKKLTDAYGVPLMIDDRVDIALAVDAAGVHVGAEDMPVREARRLMGPDKIVGATAKRVDTAMQAEADGADYLGVGAIYPTTTKVKTVLTSVETLQDMMKSDAQVVAMEADLGGASGFTKIQKSNPDRFIQCGISEANMSKLFIRFSQVDSSDTRRYGGSGLGLVITKQIVELMGGNIQVQSKEDIGSTFIVEVPMKVVKASDDALAEVEKEEEPAVFSINAHSKARILVAEDEPVNQQVIGKLLGMAGFSYDIAENGQKAVELFKQKIYDAALFDVQMPVMDGIAATQEIREIEQKEKRKRLPIIAVTARAMFGDKERILENKLDDYIAKPYNLNDVVETLNKYIDD